MRIIPEDKSSSERKVLSISDLNRKAKELLEIHLPLIWVEGEISNLSKPSSGHWYFTLKDENAQVRCAMFRGRNQLVKFSPASGDNVLLRARVSLYEGRGEFQLIAEHMEEAGFGLLQKRFEELKAKLQSEGLFDEIHKKPLPDYPKHIAVVTSTTGAAVRDVLHILKRRFPLLQVTIIPSLVQGDAAIDQLVDGVTLANKVAGFDAIILCRGGGSIEDLWAFNSEKLARAIFASTIPIISAVGHEVDFTIADFVADLRAPTPSGAAEIVSPDGDELEDTFSGYAILCQNAINRRLASLGEKLGYLRSHIRHPGERLQNRAQKLDQLEIRLRKSIGRLIEQKRSQFSLATSALPNPGIRLQQLQLRLQHSQINLHSTIGTCINNKALKLQKHMGMLDMVSPLATLKRGFAVAQNETGKVITDSAQVAIGDTLAIRLHKGSLTTEVKKVEK